MKALKITTANEISIINVEEPLHRSLGKEVGGYIEIANPRGLRRPYYCMVVNEDGLLKKKPLNLIGSILYETHMHGYSIVGDIVIMRTAEGDDGIDLVGLGDEDIAEIISIIGHWNSGVM